MNLQEFKNLFKNCEIVEQKIYVKSELLETIKYIKENYHFDMLKEIVAIDKKDEGIELNYRLYSSINEENIIVATITKDEVESVSSIYDSSVADEKEIYDLFGVKFIGNDELKRLYMPESWEGHPLKKDYEQKDERLNWND